MKWHRIPESGRTWPPGFRVKKGCRTAANWVISMKVIFVSNYFNHHQKPFCEELYRKLGSDFAFVATGTMSDERKKLGYTQGDAPVYVISAWENDQNHRAALERIRMADVVIAGAGAEEWIADRLRRGKLILRYSERPFKTKPSLPRWLYHSLRFRKRDGGNRNIYMLCASGYTAADFAGMGMYRSRMYKWGYFPAVKKYETDRLLREKKHNSILWCGRFLDWKHPDDALRLARQLKIQGYDFEMTLIGTGTMEEELYRLAKELDVADCVRFPGSMSPEQVRSHMEQAGIYLMTSDRQEGWGAVLNESMNSGCAVVASHAAGSAPFLIRDGENGLLYHSGNGDMLYEKVRYLLDHPDEQSRLGSNAYETILSLWNAGTAADRLLQLAEKILAGEKSPRPFGEGPCSPA